MLETAGPQRSADSLDGPSRSKSTAKLSGTMNRFKSMLKGQQQQQQQHQQQQQPTAAAPGNLPPSSSASPKKNHLVSVQSPPPLSISDRSSVSSCEMPGADHLHSPLAGGAPPSPLHQNGSSASIPTAPVANPKDAKVVVAKQKPALAPTPSSVSLAQMSSGSKSLITPRFEPLEDGSHMHYLRSAKRQEKLGNMLRDLLGGGRRSSAVDRQQAEAAAAGVASATQPDTTSAAQPPSLMAGFLNQLRNSDGTAAPENLLSQVAQSSMGGTSFAKKYGKCHEIIGKGSYGVVRIAHKTDPRDQREQVFAVKEVKKRSQESDAAYSKRLTSEFCISSSLHHPNIIRTLDLLLDNKGEYCEVMEFCCGGDLYSLILTAGKLEYQEADCFFKQIVRGVNYMHEMGVAHRDLKPENILLTSAGSVKITDFGNGECFRMAWEKKVHLSDGVCGSEPYIAPEEFLESKFDPRAVDIWAIGVIYMAMRTGRHLWRIAKAEEDKFYSRYLQGRKDEDGYEPIESLKRARCRNVIYSILDPVASRRITGKQILKSEWGREIRVCEAGEKGL